MLISKDIVDIIMLLWNFDNNKVKTNIYFYYKINNIELRNYEDFNLKNKYIILMAMYVFYNMKEEKYLSFNDIKNFFNITNKRFIYKKCLNALNLLSKLYIVLNDKEYKLININNNIIYSCNWINNIQLYNDIDVKLDYNTFISGKEDNIECMPLPYILINNYYNGITTYKIRELFSDIFKSDKIVRRRFIENIVEKINIILKINNLYLEFDCDLSPMKFQLGVCKVCNLNKIEEVILPINKLVKFDKNKNINKIVYFKEDEYFISNLGILYRKSKPLANTENLNGYIFNNLKDINGKQICFLRHQIVAQVFLWDKYNKNMTVDHIDRNRHNNKLNNLRWATTTEQINNRQN